MKIVTELLRPSEASVLAAKKPLFSLLVSLATTFTSCSQQGGTRFWSFRGVSTHTFATAISAGVVSKNSGVKKTPVFTLAGVALTLLTLVAALSCSVNGSPSPTNVTDGFIKRQSKQELQNLVNPNSLQPIVDAAYHAAKSNSDFTVNMVKGLWDNNKHYNYVICHPKHNYKFDGKAGEDWTQTYVTGIRSRSFDLVIGGSGTFTRHDEGGYANWAWKGSVEKGQKLNDFVVQFVKPGSTGAQIGGD